MSVPEETDTGAPATAGARLRAAREARGLSAAELAARLHLDQPMIEALERDDHARLPAPAYVRGYLRNCARLLGVSEQELLEAYQPPVPPEPETPPVRRARWRVQLPYIPLQTLIAALAIAGLLALALAYGPGLVDRIMSLRNEPAAAAGDGAPLPLPGADQPRQELPAPLPAEPAMPETAPAPAEGAPDASAETVDAEFATLAEVEARETRARQAVEEPVAAEPEPAAAGEITLELDLLDDSWVELRDGRHRRLFAGLLKMGAHRKLTGQPPLSVVLGNSPGVRLSVDGKAFDHARYNRGRVAKFEIE